MPLQIQRKHTTKKRSASKRPRASKASSEQNKALREELDALYALDARELGSLKIINHPSRGRWAYRVALIASALVAFQAAITYGAPFLREVFHRSNFFAFRLVE